MNKKLGAGALLTQLLATAAWAQTAPPGATATPSQAAQPAATADLQQPDRPGQVLPASPAGDTADQSTGSTDIVVTAQKRVERLQDVPIAVAVVEPAQLLNTGIKELQQLTSIVPGLNVSYGVGAFQPAIRGVVTSSNVVENPVALYVDGVYLPSQREGLRDLADLEQITVLKGPQGTLFGRNATAGVIQITTRAPSFTLSGAVTAGYESYDTVRASGFLTGPLASSVAASLSASYIRQGDGWGRSLTAGFDTYRLNHSISLRGKLLFRLSEDADLTIIGDYLDRSDSGNVNQPYPGTQPLFPGYGPTTSVFDTYAGTPGYSNFHGGGVSAQLDYRLDFAKLVSITSYRKGRGSFKFDFSSVAAPLSISTAPNIPNKDFTQEIQLISPSGGAFQWVVGLYYIHSRIGYDPFNRVSSGILAPLPTSIRVITSNAYETTNAIAPFAQADVKLGPDTTLTLGARYTSEKHRIAGTNSAQLVNGVRIVVPAFSPDSVTAHKPTWRVALSHKFTPDVLAYASYNRGFKSGGFNIANPSGAPYLPEKLDDWELGVKAQTADRRLTVNVNGFYYKYTNIQVNQFLAGASVATVTNGAKSELYGVDVDFVAKLTPEFSLNGGFEALHARFTSYPGAVISTPRPTGGAILASGDASGNRLPLSQKFVGTVAADYAAAIGAVNTRFNVTASYRGDYYTAPDNFVHQPHYFLLSASARLADRSDRMSLTFAASNLLNKHVIVRDITNIFGYFVNYSFQPRIYSVTAGLRF